MKKWFLRLAAVIVVFFMLNVFKNGIIQTVLSSSISGIAHVPVSIGSTRAGISSSSIELKNIKIMNPAGFPEKLMLDAPLIAITFDFQSLFKGEAHFREVRLNLQEIVVIKNHDGRLNIDAFKPSKEENEKQKQKKDERKASGKPPKIRIDEFYLTIGRVVYKDYSSGGAEPAVQTFDIDIHDRKYSNIDNPASLMSLIMFEALTRTTLSRILNLDISTFKDGALGAVSGGLGFVGDGAGTVGDAAKNILNLFH